MRASLLFLALLAAGAVNAQSPKPSDALETRITGEARAILNNPEPPALNRLMGQRFIYTGILVELTRADNPLQMLNPLAPERYGTPEDNVARDPITGRVTGLKLFSLSF